MNGWNFLTGRLLEEGGIVPVKAKRSIETQDYKKNGKQGVKNGNIPFCSLL